ncbi:MerR family transcriptional regulator [Rummeliibacillus sp. POC4]|uniref:MerR family transcriptional regulator n=1 Tax=Rummeliibacillus sp. POC4 TaxID=2305899 RepID=UPI000E6749F9|nr:MerR family transcriptional regulator [Rummeliibacillus sp. POC4]RIJ67982.1 MerR family transcriptional regulator [Rummeliibacillus sp. POC4]
MYSIGEFAKKTGLTVRSLRFYDQKGLLNPSYISEAGHRYYDDRCIETVQKIVTLKYLDYTLDEIEELLQDDSQTILSSLMFQKEQLEKKRTQIDRIIRCIDTATAIAGQSKVVEPTLFLLIIHSLLTENEQKEYLAQFLPLDLIEKMYDYTGENIIDINQQYMELTYLIKQAYQKPIADQALKSLIEQFSMIIPKPLMLEIAEALEGKVDMEMAELLFPSPFTKEEEEWFLEQAKRLGLYGGLDDE